MPLAAIPTMLERAVLAQHPARRSDAASISRASFADIDEQAAALAGWNQHYVQLSAGRFRGEVRRRQLPGIGLFIEDLQQSVRQTGHVARGMVALGVPLLLRGDARFCGQASSETHLHVFSGDDGFEFRSPQRHAMLGIEIDAALFASRVAGPAQIDATAFVREARLRCIDGAALHTLRQCLYTLLAAPPRLAATQGTAIASRLLRDAVLDRLSQALAHMATAVPPTVACVPSRAVLIEQAQSWVRDRLDLPPTVAELCEQLGVSRRTLQTSFHDAWGMGPLAWLRTLRLNAVRRALKTAPSVTAAATQLGFWHFGRFSHDYQVLFGELPSHTFRRHHERAQARSQHGAA